jgi:LCP family protein required for cell wall assembly
MLIILYLFKKIVGTILTLSMIFIIGFCSYYIYSFYSFTNKIQQTPTTPQSTSATALPEWKGKEQVNILLLGVDKREHEISTRSDSIMILSIDPITKKGFLFSVLRDTWVDIPGHKKNRINDAYAQGGPRLLAMTAEKLTGLPIQYYVVTDFKGFEKMVDAIGGVDIYVEKNMYYKLWEDNGYYDINLKKGMQHLNGKKALQYVRFRHDRTGDYTRTERQRKFLVSIVNEIKKTTNILRVPNILDSISSYITTNMNTSDMIRLVTLGYSMDLQQIRMEQIPPTTILKEKIIGGAQVIDPQPHLTKQYIQDLLEQENIENMNQK